MRSPRFMLTSPAKQFAKLKAEARRLDISVADLVRRIVDRYFEALER